MNSKSYNIIKTMEDGNVVYSRILGKDEKPIDSSLLDENHRIVKIRSLHGEEMTMYQTIKLHSSKNLCLLISYILLCVYFRNNISV